MSSFDGRRWNKPLHPFTHIKKQAVSELFQMCCPLIPFLPLLLQHSGVAVVLESIPGAFSWNGKFLFITGPQKDEEPAALAAHLRATSRSPGALVCSSSEHLEGSHAGAVRTC